MANVIKPFVQDGKEFVNLFGSDYDVTGKDEFTLFGKTYEIKHAKKVAVKAKKTREQKVDVEFIETPEEG